MALRRPRRDTADSQASSSLSSAPLDEPWPSRHASPARSDGSSGASDGGDAALLRSVSPELLAQLTERIKREVLEDLTRRGDPAAAAAPPLPRRASGAASSTSPPPPGMRRMNVAISPPLSPVWSPVASPAKEKPAVRFTNRTSFSAADKEGPRAVRPAPPQPTTSPTAELSAVDQKWGPLFDSERNPTPRLGQVLRGLANHIIDEFVPKKSIVVTPDKMYTFYANNSIDREIHPIAAIFKSQSRVLISELYQDLGCQYHLVQEDPRKPPTVPGLTPIGFAHWVTTWILAYPDQEALRLDKVVKNMPVDADSPADGKPERLPKQISRHLLPAREDPKVRRELAESLGDFFEDLNRPPSGGDAGDTATIERERKPYTAQPGSGKVHTGGGGSLADPFASRPVRANSAGVAASREPGLAPDQLRTRHSRTQSSPTNTTSNNNTAAAAPRPRPGGAARREPSPPMRGFSHSTPLELDVHGDRDRGNGGGGSGYDDVTRRRWDSRDDPRLADGRDGRDARDIRDADRYGVPKSADARLSSDDEYYRALRRSY